MTLWCFYPCVWCIKRLRRTSVRKKTAWLSSSLGPRLEVLIRVLVHRSEILLLSSNMLGCLPSGFKHMFYPLACDIELWSLWCAQAQWFCVQRFCHLRRVLKNWELALSETLCLHGICWRQQSKGPIPFNNASPGLKVAKSFSLWVPFCF